MEIDDDAGLEVDYLTLPDTVIYLNNTGSGLVVNYGYDVDENNTKYQSTDEGLLLNKTGTEILGIPYEAERLVVPATVESVTLNDENKIGSIYLEAESDDRSATAKVTIFQPAKPGRFSCPGDRTSQRLHIRI